MSSKTERDSNIELLRILAAFAVVILHFNNPLYVGGLANSEGIDHEFLIILECISIPAVNVFMMIAGYFGVDRSYIRWSKFIGLEIKVIVIYVVTYIITAYLDGSFTVRELLMSAVPNNYFITLYIVVIVFSPFINNMLNSLDQSMNDRLVVLMTAVFSVYSTGLDIVEHILGVQAGGLNAVGLYGAGRGYTIVHFLVCYIIGAWLKRNRHCDRIKTGYLIMIWVASVVILDLLYHTLGGVPFAYYNVFVMTSAISLIILFGRINIHSRIINSLAPASLTCFLINIPVLERTVPTDIVSGRHTMELILIIIVECVGIYIMAWIFDMIYTKATGLITVLVRFRDHTKPEK